MKILIDARPAFLNQAGIGNFTRNLIKAFVQISDPNRDLFYLSTTKNSKKEFKSFTWPDNFHFYENYSQQILWQLRHIFYPPVSNFDFYFSPSSLIVPALSSYPSVLVIHDLTALKFPRRHTFKTRMLERVLLRKALNKSSLIFVPSFSTKQDLISFYGKKLDKITVIGEGVEQETFFPREPQKRRVTLEKYGWQGEDFFLFVGTLEPRKNLNFLLQAYDYYCQEGGDANLFLVGRKGWSYQNIYQQVKRKKLEEKVIFLENVETDDLPAFYSQALALVFPSLYEGFGLPIIEAFACCCPVLSSNTSSLPEVVGEAGKLLSLDNYQEWAANMKRVQLDEKWRSDMIKKGEKRVELFTWEKTAHIILKTMRLYQKGE